MRVQRAMRARYACAGGGLCIEVLVRRGSGESFAAWRRGARERGGSRHRRCKRQCLSRQCAVCGASHVTSSSILPTVSFLYGAYSFFLLHIVYVYDLFFSFSF